MTDIEVLECLSKFLKNNVSNKIKLEKPPANKKVQEEYELVHPAVYTGWLPPKNFLESYGYDVPGIIIMIDQGVDDESADLNIRIKFVTYDPGETQDDGELTPNAKGYKDLLNLITKTRIELSQNPIIFEKVSVNKPIKWSMDTEQNYPYWSADMGFNVSIAPLAFNIKENFL
ncbi:hypothetical protein FDB34_13420 [Clostridium botulinum]|nr:hypothetical protein [Clostridium botulinum]